MRDICAPKICVVRSPISEKLGNFASPRKKIVSENVLNLPPRAAQNVYMD